LPESPELFSKGALFTFDLDTGAHNSGKFYETPQKFLTLFTCFLHNVRFTSQKKEQNDALFQCG
jgi:hypothetical protein